MRNANEFLAEIDSLLIGTGADIDRYAQPEFDHTIKPSHGFHAELDEHLFGEKRIVGHRLPWQKLSDHIRLRPGELTIWSGSSGHGKSLLTSQVMMTLAEQEIIVALASLEMHPVETLARMCAQWACLDRVLLRRDITSDFISRMRTNLWLYAEVGNVESKHMLALARYVRAERQCEHLVIDSLMKCGIAEGDYAKEKQFVDSLQNIAKQTGLHIHLVTHSRKVNDPSAVMRKQDISGTARITDLADNVILIARNKRKEEEARESHPDPEIMEKPDCWFMVDKQRHGTGWEGIAGLWLSTGGRFVQS